MDGLAPTTYHVLSHRFVAGIAGWTDVPALNGYALFLTIIGAPLLVVQFLIACLCVALDVRGSLTPALAIAGLLGWLLLASDRGDSSYWVSESYMVSLWMFFGGLALIGLDAPERSRVPWQMCLALAAMIFLGGLAKISTGAVLACGAAVFIWAQLGYSLKAGALGVIVGVGPFVVVYFGWPVAAGTENADLFAPFATLMKWPELSLPNLLMVPVALVLGAWGFRKTPSLRPGILAIVAMVLVANAAMLVFDINGGSANYFANLGLWATLLLIPMVGFAPIWIANRPRPWQAGLIVLGLVLIYLDTGSIKNGTKKFELQQSEIIAGMTKPAPDDGINGLLFGPMVLGAMEADAVFVPVSSTAFWSGARNCWEGAFTPQATVGSVMLMAMPDPSTGCVKTNFQGFGELDPAVSMQRELSDPEICAAARERDLVRISVVSEDLTPRLLVCDQS